jgi:hypothetical protein
VHKITFIKNNYHHLCDKQSIPQQHDADGLVIDLAEDDSDAYSDVQWASCDNSNNHDMQVDDDDI